MMHLDLILLHPPSICKFRELPIFYGPISNVIPFSSISENHPICFTSLSAYLNLHGISVKIVNLRLMRQLNVFLCRYPDGKGHVKRHNSD